MNKKSMDIRKMTQSQRIRFACALICRLTDSTPVFDHAPRAKAVLLAATHLMQAPAPIRESVFKKLKADNPILIQLVENEM